MHSLYRLPCLPRILLPLRFPALLLSFCCIGLCVSSSEAAPLLLATAGDTVTPPQIQITGSSANGITIELRLPALERTEVSRNDKTYQSLAIPGGGWTGTVGEPALPTFTRFVALPEDGEATIEATVLEEEELSGFLLAPVQGEDEKGTEFACNPDVYARDAFAPASWARLGESAVLRDVRIAPLVFQPVAYNPLRGTVRVARRVRIEVRFHAGQATGPDVAPAHPRTESRPIARSFDALYRQLIVNYDQALGGRVVRPGSWVVICPNDAAVTSRLAPLIEWRKRQGLPVRLATTAETGTTKEAIRAWLQNAWQSWDTPPEYVVLAGDATTPYAIPTWQESISGEGGEGDHPYTQLDSDDVLPDVHLGRLSFNTLTELDVIVAKIVNYESAPYPGDPGWYQRACLIADLDEWAAGWSSKLLQQWLKTRLREQGYAEVDTVFGTPLISGMIAALNRGDTIVSYRGTYQMSGWSNSLTYALTNGWKLPFVVAITCATGNFRGETSLSEGFLRANAGMNNPKGAIGAIGTATIGTHTRYNNCFQFGVFQGLLYEGQATLGAALTRGKLEMYANYQTTEPNVVLIWSYWNNLMGDPATECWTGLPEPLTVTHPDAIPIGANAATITVQRAGLPEPGALVCLWDGGTGQFTGITDPAGRVDVPIMAAAAGQMRITVTGHNRHPFLTTVPIAAAQGYVGWNAQAVDDDAVGESSGNGDGQASPGETIELPVALWNFGTEAAAGVGAILTCEDPYVTLTDIDEQYGEIAPGSAAWGTDDFGFVVSPSCPAGHLLRFGLEVQSGADVWHSILEVPVAAPSFAVEAVEVQDPGGNGFLDPGETGQLRLTLRNTDVMNATGIEGRIVSHNPWVTVNDDFASFASIDAGQTGTNGSDLFSISASAQAFKGAPASFTVITAANGGMTDTTAFTIQLGQPTTTDPTGPDAYGYFALDNTDLSYPEAPVYQWTEIDPIYGGTGEVLPIDDFEAHQDKSITVTLPFTFPYLGRPYARATICSNGWIAMGSTYLSEYRNWSIPGAGAPENLIAVFWDNLQTARGPGRVLQKYDAATHCFIVEWSRMKNVWTGNPEETFEVVLYDPAHYPTASGDGIIECRYQTIANVDQEDGYATVGMQNFDHTDGLLYTYANLYAPGAAPLANGRAIRFVPVRARPRGVIEGLVTNASFGGAPVQGAWLRVLGGEGEGTTDADGHYQLALPEGVYTAVVENESFSADSATGVVVSLTQAAHVNFALTDTAPPAISGITQIGHTPSTGPYVIEAMVVDHSTVAAATLCWRVGTGSWSEVAMTPDGSIYRASIPAGTAGDWIQYYVRAQDGIGRIGLAPPGAPQESCEFRVTTLAYAYNVESAPTGWHMGVPGDDASAGIWARGLPQPYYFVDPRMQISPAEDHTPPPGTLAFKTGTGLPFVMGGCTTLQSPFFDLRLNTGAWVGLYRWYGEFGSAPGFAVQVSNDGGATWNPLFLEPDCENWWQLDDLRIDGTVSLTSAIALRFVVCEPGSGAWVSACLDDFWIETLPPDPAGLPEPPTGAPHLFALLPVRPNPIPGGGATITFSLAQSGVARLAVYDVAGRLVKTLLNRPVPAGPQSVFWDGHDGSGAETGAGVYFCRLEAAGRTSVSRIVRVR